MEWTWQAILLGCLVVADARVDLAGGVAVTAMLVVLGGLYRFGGS